MAERLRVLSDVDKEYLIERLTAWIGPMEKPRETLVAPFIDTPLPAVLTTGLPSVIVRDLVRLCIADGWNHTPPWLVVLVKSVPAVFLDEKLIEIRDRIPVQPPAGSNRLDATVLDNNTPFVNRTALRNQLRRLATAVAATRPILVVTGSTKSGKSHSIEYIDHFALQPPPPAITYRYALREGTELETGPDEVAVDLVAQTGRKPEEKPQPHTNQKKHAEDLATWVLRELVQSSMQQQWIMLDNFQGEKLRPDTRDFVIALADRVTNGVFKEKCRLFLIGFDRSHLTVSPGRVEEERIAACAVKHIKECVDEIASRAPVALTLDLLYDFATKDLPAANGRMPELNTRLRGLLMAVEQITEISSAITLDFEAILDTILHDLPAGAAMLPEIEKRLDDLRTSAAEVGV